MRDQELIQALREHAEWQRGNEWETPITLGDDLVAAADRLANRLAGVRPRLRVRALLTQTRGTEVVTAAATMLTQMRLPVYRTAIRRTDKVPESTMTLLPLRQYSPGSAAARDYRVWAKELMEEVI